MEGGRWYQGQLVDRAGRLLFWAEYQRSYSSSIIFAEYGWIGGGWRQYTRPELVWLVDQCTWLELSQFVWRAGGESVNVQPQGDSQDPA